MSAPEHPVTPTKRPRNDGASRADPYAADPYRLSDEEEGLGSTKIRPPRHVLQYEVVKRWVTGEKALQSDAQIRAELEEEMYRHMELSGQRKFFGHKSLATDLGSWKLGRSHTNKYHILFDVYRCPLRNRCDCQCSMRVVTGPDYIELQRCGLHDKNSHDNDKSKTLTYAEINSVVEAVKTAPTMPGSEIRRNLLDHDSPTKSIPDKLKRCVERRVYSARKNMTKKQLDGYKLTDSFGSLTVFSEINLFSTLMRKHNDPEYAYHFRLFDFVVLGSQVTAEHDLVRITFGSVWMMLNAYRAIIAGWGFQLNGDVTGKYCNKSVDLVEFSVTSIPKQNNILCLGVIPKGTESETLCRITWNDFRVAAIELANYKDCGKQGCFTCQMVMPLLAHPNVVEEMATKAWKEEEKLPVETAMCDNFKGWGNFSINELGIVSNDCLPHGTGKVHYFFYVFFHANGGHCRYCGLRLFACPSVFDQSSVR